MLKHGILGLLNYGDMTGYEICETFHNSLNFFWSAQTSQIYRELATLEENNWIVKRTVEQSGKPNKNICEITEEGRNELKRWLIEPTDMSTNRSPMLMKTFFMGELPDIASLEFFRQLRQEYRLGIEELQQTDDIIPRYRELVPQENNSIFWQMTADYGKRYAQMNLEWIESCIQILETMEGKEQ